MPSEAPPKVSVIVPCYNLGAFLDETIESVLAQTFQDFEIVIVNDGSTDPDTNNLLTDFRRPKTRVLMADHRGVAAARNLAIEHSRGPYLCALDADDKLDPSFLEKTSEILDKNDALTFVSCWLQTFGSEDWVWKQDRCDLPTLLGECTVATPALVRKEAVLAVDGFDTMLQGYEDWDLWISLVERGFRGTIIPEVLFYYRRRSNSLSQSCCRGEPHLSMMRHLISKHAASYRQHLSELLIQKEVVSCELLKRTYALEREIDDRLLPTIESRRQELERIRRRLETVDQRERTENRLTELEREATEAHRQTEELRLALGQAQSEISALRQSGSWRITAPLRAVSELLQRFNASARMTPARGADE